MGDNDGRTEQHRHLHAQEELQRQREGRDRDRHPHRPGGDHPAVAAQRDGVAAGDIASVGQARDALRRARAQGIAAAQRGTRLETQARAATQAADRTAREAAALAAA